MKKYTYTLLFILILLGQNTFSQTTKQFLPKLSKCDSVQILLYQIDAGCLGSTYIIVDYQYYKKKGIIKYIYSWGVMKKVILNKKENKEFYEKIRNFNFFNLKYDFLQDNMPDAGSVKVKIKLKNKETKSKTIFYSPASQFGPLLPIDCKPFVSWYINTCRSITVKLDIEELCNYYERITDRTNLKKIRLDYVPNRLINSTIINIKDTAQIKGMIEYVENGHNDELKKYIINSFKRNFKDERITNSICKLIDSTFLNNNFKHSLELTNCLASQDSSKKKIDYLKLCLKYEDFECKKNAAIALANHKDDVGKEILLFGFKNKRIPANIAIGSLLKIRDENLIDTLISCYHYFENMQNKYRNMYYKEFCNIGIYELLTEPNSYNYKYTRLDIKKKEYFRGEKKIKFEEINKLTDKYLKTKINTN